MTIPIIPGPFSFLEQLGQGVGNYLQGREAGRQQALEEMRQHAMDAITLRDKGYLDPSQFGAMAGSYLSRLGVDPKNMRSTGSEIQGNFMEGLANRYMMPQDVQVPGLTSSLPTTTVPGRSSMTDAQRMTAQKFLGEVPQSDVIGEKLKVQTGEGQLPTAKAVGEATGTGQLRDQASQDADYLVQAYIARNGLPKSTDAVSAVSNIRQFAGQYGEQYRSLVPRLRDEDLLAAFTRARMLDYKMQTERLASAARNFAVNNTALNDVADNFRQQAQLYQQTYNDEAGLRVASGLDQFADMVVRAAETAQSRGQPLSPIQQQALAARAKYNALRAAAKFNWQLNEGFANQVNNRMAGTRAPQGTDVVLGLPSSDEQALSPSQRGWLKMARTALARGARPGGPGWVDIQGNPLASSMPEPSPEEFNPDNIGNAGIPQQPSTSLPRRRR